MEIYRSIQAFNQKNGSDTALSIGNFDGCHRGHKQLIGQTRRFADQHNLMSTVLTFDPHPDQFFKHKDPSQQLFTLDQKIEAFAELGLAQLIIQPFDHDFSSLTHEQFYRLLTDHIKARAIFVGRNFRFGYKRRGDVFYLEQACRLDGLTCVSSEPETYQELPISSTRVRKALASGNISEATELLGHNYSIVGTIERGEQLGRKIGFPTANLSQTKQLIPKSGVYCGYVSINDKTKSSVLSIDPSCSPAVINIGFRPTLGKSTKRQSIEAHLFNQEFDSDVFYQKNAVFYFVKKLRDEKKFENLDSLSRAIQNDIEKARLILS